MTPMELLGQWQKVHDERQFIVTKYDRYNVELHGSHPGSYVDVYADTLAGAVRMALSEWVDQYGTDLTPEDLLHAWKAEDSTRQYLIENCAAGVMVSMDDRRVAVRRHFNDGATIANVEKIISAFSLLAG